MNTTMIGSSQHPTRGSALLISVLTVMCISIIALSILSFASTTYRNTMRKQTYEKAKISATNEMEWLFYNWATNVEGVAVESKLTTAGLTVSTTEIKKKTPAVEGMAAAPGITDSTFTYASEVPYIYPSLTIARSLAVLGRPATGEMTMDSGLSKTGSVRYYDARVCAELTHPLIGKIQVTQGRRFAIQKVSPFNFSVYYQGDLEMGASSNMYIQGDIESNGRVYLGSQSGYSLKIGNKIYHHGAYNGASDPTNGMSGTQHKIASGDSLVDPLFTTDGTTWSTTTGRNESVVYQNKTDNFIGGVDAAQLATLYPTAYPTENDVYRSIIAPPPASSVATDATVEANRMYNKAFLRIVVNTDNSVSIVDGNGNTYSAPDITPQVRTDFRDAREDSQAYSDTGDSSKHVNVKMTTIDISKLKSFIDANPTLQSEYNGVVYIYDKNSQYDKTVAATNPSKVWSKNGIRLINGTSTPNYNEKGFTIASDNGVYVQGNYNTTAIDASGTVNSAAIMGDALTILSSDWSDAAAFVDPADPQSDTAKFGGTVRQATQSITVNAAVISGNTATYESSPGVVPNADHLTGTPRQSGGVQNLVRYLEDWRTNGLTTTVNGSIAQLFNSKYFNSYYLGQTNSRQDIYLAPPTRNMIFDTNLASNPPGGAPTAKISYFRGDIFDW